MRLLNIKNYTGERFFAIIIVKMIVVVMTTLVAMATLQDLFENLHNVLNGFLNIFVRPN